LPLTSPTPSGQRLRVAGRSRTCGSMVGRLGRSRTRRLPWSFGSSDRAPCPGW
jgi:hypothetical protein